MKKWYERAKPMLREKGISQQEVADKIGCNQSAASHKLNGRRGATIEEAQLVADMLGVSIITFLEDDPETARSDEEKQLLRQFRELDDDQRSMTLKMIKAMN